MNKKIFIIIIVLLVLICSIVIYINITNNEEKSIDDKFSDFNDYTFILDSNNKYEIITDMKWYTMRNDGGSHTSIYYQVDLDNNIISKIEEDYQANLGGQSKLDKKVIYIKSIDTNTKENINLLLNEIITKQDTNETHNYNFFTILGLNYEKDIYNVNTIESINSLLQKIDELENKTIPHNLFNKKIIYNFGIGSAFEIDIPQIINYYNEIVIRNNYLLLFSNEDNISIGKNETIFEKLPPNDEMLVAGASKYYKLLYENDDTKLYEVTYNFSYMSPNGGETESNISYILYKKADDCTIEITGTNKDNVFKMEKYIVPTNQTKTLEEQFYGITVFDNRIIDTSKVTINEIYNVGGFIDIAINIDDTDINVRFLSKSDKSYLPELKRIKDWKLITEKDGYKIYHGCSGSVQSDALKIIKDSKEYYIDLSIPSDIYKEERKTNSDGSISIYMYLTQETIGKIVEEIFNIIL